MEEGCAVLGSSGTGRDGREFNQLFSRSLYHLFLRNQVSLGGGPEVAAAWIGAFLAGTTGRVRSQITYSSGHGPTDRRGPNAGPPVTVIGTKQGGPPVPPRTM